MGTRVDDLGRWVWEPWRDHAACTDADPSLFYGRTGEGPAARRMRVMAAKQVCDRCPVLADCLRFAYENGESSGIWGGLTGEERAQRRIAARRPAAA
jgi:WhiB family redox-sensing transcriptional regulator